MKSIDISRVEKLRIAAVMDANLSILSIAELLGQRKIVARMLLHGDGNEEMQNTYEYINETLKNVMGIE